MDFHKTHSIKIRFVTGPENILFAGVCVYILARKFYGLGQWRGYLAILSFDAGKPQFEHFKANLHQYTRFTEIPKLTDSLDKFKKKKKKPPQQKQRKHMCKSDMVISSVGNIMCLLIVWFCFFLCFSPTFFLSVRSVTGVAINSTHLPCVIAVEQTDKTGKCTDRLTKVQTIRQRDKFTDRQAPRQTHRQVKRKADKYYSARSVGVPVMHTDHPACMVAGRGQP